MSGWPAVIDGRAMQAGFKAHKERGIGRYAQNLLAAMLAEVGPQGLELLVQGNLPDPDFDSRVKRLPAGYLPRWLPYGKRLISHYWLARRPLLPAWRAGRVVHFIAHLDAPLWPLRPTVITVHDLIAQRLPQIYSQGVSQARFRLERWVETRCLGRAQRLIAVSECTKRDLVELYGLDPERVSVVHEAADPHLAPVADPAARAAVLARHGLEPGAPFFFYLGGIDQRKDMPGLLEALAICRATDERALLVMAGSIEGDKQYPAFLGHIKRLGLEHAVRRLGFVADDDLPALFSACVAFVFPSLYEGFGLPPLEAMACGAPVIAVAAAAVPEVVGQAGLLTPPGRPAELAQAMGEVLVRPELADQLRQAGAARARLFSWRRAARETLAVYGQALEEWADGRT
ncbi:glycosyltransferase family 4 protein [Desulfarculus baarsii]